MSDKISDEQNDAESELCGWAKTLIKMGVEPDTIHGQVDNAISEAFEEIKQDNKTHNIEALKLALAILGPFKEAGNIYKDYQDSEMFTNKEYDGMLNCLEKMLKTTQGN